MRHNERFHAPMDGPCRVGSADLPDPIALLQAAVRCNTVNPPGNEAALARMMCDVLADAGTETDLRPRRTSLSRSRNIWPP